ncbi:hypothetical protein DKX38_029842 [Salix brachista]|uniref:Uncharacterized protein n=1 Tax=Salix brachista TaxID=2182728 RepID=A0A5N5J4G0_9ROSI|nr:hypothetical protein DKX38_029842 [Salix brachista]
MKKETPVSFSESETRKRDARSRMSATATTAQNLSKTSPLLAPAVVAAYAAYRYKSELADGCQKISGANKLLSSSSSVACESNLPEWPALSISRSSRLRFHQHLHCWSSKGHQIPLLLFLFE